MPLNFPPKTSVEATYSGALDYTINNYGKTVTLFYHTYVSGATDSPIGPGNIGGNFLSNGSTAFSPNNNFLAGSGTPMIEQRQTGVIKLLCTFNPQNVSERFRKDDAIGIQFKKELTYIYTRGYMSDYLNIVNCDYAIFNIPASSVDQMKFKLASQPRDKNSVCQGRYINSWWEQIP